MQKTEKFFIFSWKELFVIALLILTTLGFFFTLGLHYGKKLHGEPTAAAEAPAGSLEEGPEPVPPKEALDQGAHHAGGVAQEAIKSATEEAVQQADLRVEQPKPVDLPKEKAVAKAEAPADEEAEVEHAPVAAAKFAVQLGSYPNKKEAQLKISILNKRGLRPEIRTAQVNGSTRYRVVLTGFKSKSIAESRGKELRAKRKIENFVIIKSD
jgi:cell division protein FtsN